MFSNMKYYENICTCLRVIQQDINRKLKSANCWQRTSLNLVDVIGDIVSEGIKKATRRNEFSTSVFTKENTSKVQSFNIRSEGVTIDNFDITADMVGKYLKQLNASKSQGSDNLHPKPLLETLDEIKEPLTEIFKKSLQEGSVPNDWKLANIVPLHK